MGNVPCLGEYGNCLVTNLSTLSQIELFHTDSSHPVWICCCRATIQKTSPTRLTLVSTSFTLVPDSTNRGFVSSPNSFVFSSPFLVQAPQHHHQDVVLLPSAPLNFMLSKAFLATFAEEWNTIDVYSNCMCACDNRQHLCIDGRVTRCFRLSSRHAPRCLMLHPSRTSWSRAPFPLSHRQLRTLPFSTWEACNRCRSTLSHRSSRGSPHWLLRLWVRRKTTDSRQQCSCCQRSATMFAVFLHYTAVLNCVRATHGLAADRAPVYRGCPCRDPLGCPLIPKQNGIRDKAPTLWLLLCCCNCWDCCMCARAINIGHAFTRHVTIESKQPHQVRSPEKLHYPFSLGNITSFALSLFE